MTDLRERLIDSYAILDAGSQHDIDFVHALIDSLCELREALTSIASAHHPSDDTEERWLKRTHEQCATVLATDTKIARNALAASDERLGKFVGGE